MTQWVLVSPRVGKQISIFAGSSDRRRSSLLERDKGSSWQRKNVLTTFLFTRWTLHAELIRTSFVLVFSMESFEMVLIVLKSFVGSWHWLEPPSCSFKTFQPQYQFLKGTTISELFHSILCWKKWVTSSNDHWSGFRNHLKGIAANNIYFNLFYCWFSGEIPQNFTELRT